MAKKAIKSKTLWANGLTVVGTLIANYAGFLPPPALPYVVALAGVVNVALRFLTTEPVSLKGSE